MTMALGPSSLTMLPRVNKYCGQSKDPLVGKLVWGTLQGAQCEKGIIASTFWWSLRKHAVMWSCTTRLGSMKVWWGETMTSFLNLPHSYVSKTTTCSAHVDAGWLAPFKGASVLFVVDIHKLTIHQLNRVYPLDPHPRDSEGIHGIYPLQTFKSTACNCNTYSGWLPFSRLVCIDTPIFFFLRLSFRLHKGYCVFLVGLVGISESWVPISAMLALCLCLLDPMLAVTCISRGDKLNAGSFLDQDRVQWPHLNTPYLVLMERWF
jgi:hypothetical protein